MKPAQVIDLSKIESDPQNIYEMVKRFRDEDCGPHERKVFISRMVLEEIFLRENENTPEIVRGNPDGPVNSLGLMKALSFIMTREEFPELYQRMEGMEEWLEKFNIRVSASTNLN